VDFDKYGISGIGAIWMKLIN